MKKQKHLAKVKKEETTEEEMDDSDKNDKSLNNNEDCLEENKGEEGEEDNASSYEDLCKAYQVQSSGSSSSSRSESLPKGESSQKKDDEKTNLDNSISGTKRPRRPGPEELNIRTPILQRLQPNPKKSRRRLDSEQ